MGILDERGYPDGKKYDPYQQGTQGRNETPEDPSPWKLQIRVFDGLFEILAASVQIFHLKVAQS